MGLKLGSFTTTTFHYGWNAVLRRGISSCCVSVVFEEHSLCSQMILQGGGLKSCFEEAICMPRPCNTLSQGENVVLQSVKWFEILGESL